MCDENKVYLSFIKILLNVSHDELLKIVECIFKWYRILYSSLCIDMKRCGIRLWELFVPSAEHQFWVGKLETLHFIIMENHNDRYISFSLWTVFILFPYIHHSMSDTLIAEVPAFYFSISSGVKTAAASIRVCTFSSPEKLCWSPRAIGIVTESSIFAALANYGLDTAASPAPPLQPRGHASRK